MSAFQVQDYSLLVTAFSAVVAAQVIKFVLASFEQKKTKWLRLVEPGGMPSSHTAIVVSLVMAIYLRDGAGTDVFAVSAVFASVVIFDAMGIRRSAGEHAKQLNILIKASKMNRPMTFLKEKLGHTPVEVLGGGILGFFVALAVRFLYQS